MSKDKRRAKGRPTSVCMQELFKVKFKGHERSDVVQQDVRFWLSFLADHVSVPRRNRLTTVDLLANFEAGVITSPYYVYLIRAALAHSYQVLEVNELQNSVKQLGMHILEDRDVVTLRSAAKQLNMKPYQLVRILNGHKPADQELDVAIHDLVQRVGAEKDALINRSVNVDTVDYLDWDPENGDFYPDDPDIGPENEGDESDLDDEDPDDES
ncbi:MAG: hypothetical protein WCW66_02095 [Patescibacteria group bacterium]